MAKEILNLEVKSNIKSVSQDTDKMADSLDNVNQEAKEGIGNFTLMGVSLNGVKAAFGKVIPMAKAMFGTIKAGIISTGIGVLLIAFGTLMTWLTKTKKGAEMLERVFAGVGAAVDVIVDRITKFASAVGKLFSGNIKGGLRALTGTFKGMGDEMSREIRLAVELKAKLQELTDSERELNVEFAQRRAEIEELKMISEDLTKTEEERLKATKKAFKIENDLLDKNINLKETAVEIQREQNALGENMAEDLDALAEKEITLANIRGESATKQIELNNKINSIESETKAKRQAAHTERLAQIAEAEQAELDRISAVKTAEVDLQNSITLLLIEDAQLRGDELLHIQLLAEEASIEAMKISDADKNKLLELFYEREDLLLDQKLARDDKIREAANKKREDDDIASEQAIADAKERIRDANISNIASGLNSIKALAGENKAMMAGVIIAENALGIARTIIATSASNTAAIAEGAALAIPTMGASVAAATALVATNNIAAALSIAASIAATKQGLSALGKSGGGGGGGMGGAPSASSSPPAPEMMSGAFELTGGVEPEPLQAYVVSDDITNSQNALEIIRRRATI
tara:strand:+ start:331 stop:2070 length:1740 start_codon:yes stop_codon:yes gene_type:complete